MKAVTEQSTPTRTEKGLSGKEKVTGTVLSSTQEELSSFSPTGGLTGSELPGQAAYWEGPVGDAGSAGLGFLVQLCILSSES